MIPLVKLVAKIKAMQEEADRLQKELATYAKKKRRLTLLQSQLQGAAAILRGDTLADKPKSRHGFVGGKRAKPIQQGSSVWWTAKVLFLAQMPMHIDRILDRIKTESGQTFKKPTVVSNLSRYVKYGDTFVRPAPNVYALSDFTFNIDRDLNDLIFETEDDDDHADILPSIRRGMRMGA